MHEQAFALTQHYDCVLQSTPPVATTVWCGSSLPLVCVDRGRVSCDARDQINEIQQALLPVLQSLGAPGVNFPQHFPRCHILKLTCYQQNVLQKKKQHQKT